MQGCECARLEDRGHGNRLSGPLMLLYVPSCTLWRLPLLGVRLAVCTIEIPKCLWRRWCARLPDTGKTAFSTHSHAENKTQDGRSSASPCAGRDESLQQQHICG